MTRQGFLLRFMLLQAAVGGVSAELTGSARSKQNATSIARHQRAPSTYWKKEPFCLNKESDCRCPISPAYKESPAPRCPRSNTFDGCGRRVCYYNNEAHMRTKSETTGQPDMPYYIFDTPGCLCTHLVYGFALVDSNLRSGSSINLLWPYSNDVPCDRPCKGPKQEPNLDHPGMVNCMKHAKKTNPSLRTILGVGGKQQKNEHFSFMLQTPETRRIFIQDVKNTLETYQFEGIDINWPFPGFRCNSTGKHTDCGQNSNDKYRFTSFLKELRQAVPPELSVTATVSCHPELIQSAYEPHKMIYHVDWLNLMAFNLHNRHDQEANHPSRLNPKFDGDHANVKWCVQHWLDSAWKADPSSSTNVRKQIKRKLVLGLNLYPTFYKLSKPNVIFIRKNSTEPAENASLHHAQVNMSLTREQAINASLMAAQDYTSTEKGNMSLESNSVSNHDDEKEPPQNISLGPAQEYTKTNGFMSFFELCEFRKTHFLEDRRLDELEGGNANEKSGQEPIVKNPWLFIAYEDAYSLRKKVQYATNVEDLGGVMIWDITADDFRGEFCNQGSHPLLHSITDSCMYERLTAKPEVVVSPDPQCGDKRKAPSGTGYQQLEHGRWIPMPCAPGTAFSVITCVCDWPQGSSAPPARQQPPMTKLKTASKAGGVWRESGLRLATRLALATMAATMAPW